LVKLVLKALWVAALAALCAPDAAAQDSNSASPAVTAVLAVSAARDKAFVAGSTSGIAIFLADDFLETNEFGKVQDKATWLQTYFAPIAQLITSNQFKWTLYQRSAILSRDYGNVVVLIGRLQSKSSITNVSSGDSPPVTYRFTEVWTKRDGAWKLSVAQRDRPTNSPGTSGN